jgi:hypothetical protein
MYQKQVLPIVVIQIVVRYGKKTTGKYVLAPKTCTLTREKIVTTQLNLVIKIAYVCTLPIVTVENAYM